MGSATEAFGSAGEKAISNAFTTKFTFDPGYSVFDIESIVLHEIGHALGLRHPDIADDIGRNFDPNSSAISATGEEVVSSSLVVSSKG